MCGSLNDIEILRGIGIGSLLIVDQMFRLQIVYSRETDENTVRIIYYNQVKNNLCDVGYLKVLAL